MSTRQPTTSKSQARLLEVPDRPWRLDEATRERGRRGVAEAKAALTAAIRARHREHADGQQAA